MMKLTVKSNENKLARMQLSGRVTQDNISPFVEPIGAELGPDGYSSITLLDMQDVQVLDSSGIGWLLTCHKRFREAGGTLVLHSLSPLVFGVLKVLNLQSVLRIAEDEQAAIQETQGESA